MQNYCKDFENSTDQQFIVKNEYLCIQWIVYLFATTSIANILLFQIEIFVILVPKIMLQYGNSGINGN